MVSSRYAGIPADDLSAVDAASLAPCPQPKKRQLANALCGQAEQSCGRGYFIRSRIVNGRGRAPANGARRARAARDVLAMARHLAHVPGWTGVSRAWLRKGSSISVDRGLRLRGVAGAVVKAGRGVSHPPPRA